MIQAQFGHEDPKISKYPLIGILRSQGPKQSVLYSQLLRAKLSGISLKIKDRWKEELPDMSEERWDRICSLHMGVSPVIVNKLIKLYIIHQTYSTPQKMHRVGRMAIGT